MKVVSFHPWQTKPHLPPLCYGYSRRSILLNVPSSEARTFPVKCRARVAQRPRVRHYGVSAAFKVKCINQGLLLLRLTTAQRNDVANPAAGLLIYNTSPGNFEGYAPAVTLDQPTEIAGLITDQNSPTRTTLTLYVGGGLAGTVLATTTQTVTLPDFFSPPLPVSFPLPNVAPTVGQMYTFGLSSTDNSSSTSFACYHANAYSRGTIYYGMPPAVGATANNDLTFTLGFGGQ